ncbi:MAG: agmatine deiminase family protein [Muribaculaceae bacterium]|nr:agmatine deiminase family protein [Muribaculaceae bacterium]
MRKEELDGLNGRGGTSNQYTGGCNRWKMDDKIFDHLTNQCYFSRLLADTYYGMNILNKLLENDIRVNLIEMSRDIWCRDYMPIQISDNKYVSFDYQPDYLYNQHDYQYITNPARIIRDMGICTQPIGLILDGGNVVKTRKGIIMVDKVIKENNHLPEKEVIDRLEKAFESEIILLPWERIERYGHADGIVREISHDKVLMTNYHQYNKKYADKYLKILSKRFDVEVLDFNAKKPSRYSWSYINFLRIGNKIFLPQLTWEDYFDAVLSPSSPPVGTNNKFKPKWYHFKIEEDDQAFEQFAKLLPDCEIIPVSCPHIVEHGGGLNCVSWNIKRLGAS